MPSRFRVVAIVAAYNESDIIAQVVADLIAQGTDVYFLDDGSSDGTVAAVEPFVGHGVLAIEPLRVANRPASVERFDWEIILRRKADVARSIDADWFIHHDADELRESPWRGVTLSDAVQRVDAADFNAIDFASLDFWPVHDGFQTGDDLRTAFTHYSRRAPYDAVQIRAWKNTGADVDLVSSGGHDIQFPGRHVFPIRFLSRHYPIRLPGSWRAQSVSRASWPLSSTRARTWLARPIRCAPGRRLVRSRPRDFEPYTIPMRSSSVWCSIIAVSKLLEGGTAERSAGACGFDRDAR